MPHFRGIYVPMNAILREEADARREILAGSKGAAFRERRFSTTDGRRYGSDEDKAISVRDTYSYDLGG